MQIASKNPQLSYLSHHARHSRSQAGSHISSKHLPKIAFDMFGLPDLNVKSRSRFSARFPRWRQSTASVGALLLAVIFSTVSQAHDGTWTITRHSGDVRLVNDGVVLSSLSESMAVLPGTGIRTGENGRIMLTHAGESMMISPNSTITIPNTFARNGYSTLLQKRGSVRFEVEKDQGRSFRVLTPYLAAVVKGTQFIITLAADDNRVEVLDGQVDVSEFRTGQVGSVSAGQTAVVRTASMGLQVIGSGFIQPIRQGAPLPSPVIPEVEAESRADADLRDLASSSQPDPISGIRAKDRASPTGGATSSGSELSNGSSGVGRHSAWLDTDFNWTALALPVALGFAVAFSVAMRTQRRSKTKEEKEHENLD
jgi:hypothetical protein